MQKFFKLRKPVWKIVYWQGKPIDSLQKLTCVETDLFTANLFH